MNTDAITLFNQTVRFQKRNIWVQPVCDFFGIDYKHQVKKISQDSILKDETVKDSNSELFGDKYQRILLTQKGFIRWIQLINANTVVEELREKFEQFQRFIFDFLFLFHFSTMINKIPYKITNIYCSTMDQT